jgi:Trp operon repressor
LESDSSYNGARTALAMMTPDTAAAGSRRAQIVRELLELIAALDRRVPQVQRVGEISIARAASALKLEALKRIEQLECEPPPPSSEPRRD